MHQINQDLKKEHSCIVIYSFQNVSAGWLAAGGQIVKLQYMDI